MLHQDRLLPADPGIRLIARTLYERAGLYVASEQFELPEIGPHVVMRTRL